ncbi:MAG: Chaperone protein HtpG [Candidatus Ozemobacter sibiricus]|jgi:molecular chaperone HtpG|uniref:Chaperone protein HtpG n=1 Tax=Candidatus Ozemobacter sibiricus TaxID=2268124 RepID=A0A367ZNL4_9BACT|nr:MAG: Chaperone protein HtpG [Candidatus Ozemobacter sibiricus]
MSTETRFEFKAEARQILDLMIHSVYSHREIFLRELISNASDALDKLRFEALTNDALRPLTEDLHIRITADPKERTLSVSDNGIGMNRDEILQYIGTIAKSGTRDFAKALKEAKDKTSAPEFIGQFGVGFYSSFMVADKVTLVSRRAGDTKAWKWESDGTGTFTLEESARDSHGTTVMLHLKPIDKDDDDAEDYTQEWVIRDIVRKYSDFVAYPIRMKVERQKWPKDADGKTPPDAKPETVIEDETLNSMKAIWMRPEKEVSEEEYKEFYKHISHDWNDPLRRIVFKLEGTTSEFRALLFLPSKPTPEMFLQPKERGIHLYIKRVFIMNDCKELIPEYLRFVRGVVDSEDLSLNISREILQHNKQIQIIKKSVTRKVLDTFKAMRNEDRKKFLEFWKDFGATIKEGLFKAEEDRDKLFEVCLFPSTAAGDDLCTLEEYVERMKPGQDAIYYVTGETRTTMENSPLLEAFRDKGYEVLLLSDPVDEVWVQFVREYKGKRLVSAAKGDVKLGTEEEKKKAEEAVKQKSETYKDLLEFLKTRLSDHLKDVRLSSRLTSSPACLVGDLGDMSPHMETLLKASGKELPKVKRILELNPDHPLVEKMQALFAKNKEDPVLLDTAEILYNQALIAEGGKPENPAAFSKKVADLLLKAL